MFMSAKGNKLIHKPFCHFYLIVYCLIAFYDGNGRIEMYFFYFCLAEANTLK